MSDFTSKTVNDLREMLVKSGKYTDEQTKLIKGKAKLVEAVLELNEEDLVDLSQAKFEDVEIEISSEDDGPTDVPRPGYTSPEWSDYVLTQFSENELRDGHPTVVGLRRVASKLLGPIISSGPRTLTSSMTTDGPGRASCIYDISIVFNLVARDIRQFSAAAGAWVGNTDDEYAVYPEAIAEVRAEGRALRKALALNIVCADELTSKNTKEIVKESMKKDTSSGDWQESDNISEVQIMFLKKKCTELGINIDKFINSGKNQYTEIGNIPRAIAAKMIERLNDYQTNTDRSVKIPDELKSV